MRLSRQLSLVGINKFVGKLISQPQKDQVGFVVDVCISQNGTSFDTIECILFAYTVSVFLGTKDFGKYIFHFDKDHLVLRHHIVCF